MDIAHPLYSAAVSPALAMKSLGVCVGDEIHTNGRGMTYNLGSESETRMPAPSRSGLSRTKRATPNPGRASRLRPRWLRLLRSLVSLVALATDRHQLPLLEMMHAEGKQRRETHAFHCPIA